MVIIINLTLKNADKNRLLHQQRKLKEKVMIRRWRTVPFRLKPLLFFIFILYLFLFIPSFFINNEPVINDDKPEINQANNDNSYDRIHVAGGQLLEARIQEVKKNEKQLIEGRRINPKIIVIDDKKEDKIEKDKDDGYKIFYEGKELYIDSILTHPLAESLKERVYLDPKYNKTKKKLVSMNAGFNNAHLGGCPDWNCEFGNPNDDNADVYIMMNPQLDKARNPNQLFVFYSQESRRNSLSLSTANKFFNLTLGFRHDSVSASPYGYTVKLSEKSRISKDVSIVNETMIRNKTKGATWFVSHCHAQSGRDDLVKSLQEHFQVDIYGSCGTLTCPKNNPCEKSIDNDYHFYLALENSICDDYITEKLWNQGYRYTVIPIVLKRKLIENYVPPKSFIAFDDFDNIQDMAKYLKYLMDNKTAYMEYFEWKREYSVIYLNGLKHDELERPWGFCQLCRLAHIVSSTDKDYISSKFKLLNVDNLENKWDNSCDDPDNKLARNILDKTNQKKDNGVKNDGQILVESQMRVNL